MSSVCKSVEDIVLDAADPLAYYRSLKRCHMTHMYKDEGFRVEPHEARDFADACKRAGIQEKEVRCLHDDIVASEVEAFRKIKEAEVEAFRKEKEAEVEAFRKEKEAEVRASWTADEADGLKNKDSSVSISIGNRGPQILLEDASADPWSTFILGGVGKIAGGGMAQALMVMRIRMTDQ